MLLANKTTCNGDSSISFARQTGASGLEQVERFHSSAGTFNTIREGVTGSVPPAPGYHLSVTATGRP